MSRLRTAGYRADDALPGLGPSLGVHGSTEQGLDEGSYAAGVERSIVRFAQDDAGDWVAELVCFHRRHVRHDPPFQLAPWVLDADARAERVGAVLECVLCDRLELPADLEVVRTTDTWDERTMPAGLRRAHRVAADTWGRIRVEAGTLRFRAQTSSKIKVVLGAGASQAIPPGVEHDVEPMGAVRFSVEFLRPAPSGPRRHPA